MLVNAYKTHKIQPHEDLFKILDKYLSKLDEKSIVVITSKIVSLTEGHVVKNDGRTEKHDLAKKESQYYLGDEYPAPYGHLITIKNDILIPSAGIDESNSNGYFVLYPEDLQETANSIWRYLRKKHQLKELGIIISDSHTTPLRWGVTGIGLSWCGFKSMNNLVGSDDLFGRKLISTQASVLDGITAAAVVVMGEGAEQTPLAVVSNVTFVSFQDREPTQKELDAIKITKEKDIYGPLLTSVKWEKGGDLKD